MSESNASDGADSGVVCAVCCWGRVEVTLTLCGHQFCTPCLQTAFSDCLRQGKGQLQCLQCSTDVLPHEVARIAPGMFERYIDFALRKYLVTVGSVRYCPAPDCEYACIWENVSGCKDTHFVCQHQSCGREFCYECKRPWHMEQTCQQAREQVAVNLPEDPLSGSMLRGLNVKQCPACSTSIEKVRDDTCNLVNCDLCGKSFCWLCGKEASEMHFFSPTGCGMYGRRQWSPRKLWCFRAWLWVLAVPLVVVVTLLLGPVVMVLFPVGLAYLAYTARCCAKHSKAARVCWTVSVILLCMAVDLLVGLLWTLLFPPLALAYIYIVIPVHLVRSGTCCRTVGTSEPSQT